MICSVFRQRRRVDGVLRVAQNYSGRLRMPWERQVSTIALHTSDKRIALWKLGEIAKEREKEHNGLIAPKVVRDAAESPLTALLAEYFTELETRGRRPRTIRKYRSVLTVLFKRCRWEHVQDVTARSFCLCRTQAGWSGKTANDILAAAKGFFDWLERQRLVLENPLKHVERVDTRERSQFRRALTEDEMRRLLAVAPPFRAVVYLTALYTGLRRAELNQLRWGDLHLDGPNPYVLAPASITKNKKNAEIPLRGEVVAALLSIRPSDAAPFTEVFRNQVPRVRTLRKDLSRAGIPFLDNNGRRLDFHALRATFCTMLAVNRIPLNEAMQLMRHSDPKLTMKVYTDRAQLGLSGVLTRLPSINLPPITVAS